MRSSQLWDRVILMVSADDLAWTYCCSHPMACVDRIRMLLQNIHYHVCTRLYGVLTQTTLWNLTTVSTSNSVPKIIKNWNVDGNVTLRKSNRHKHSQNNVPKKTEEQYKYVAQRDTPNNVAESAGRMPVTWGRWYVRKDCRFTGKRETVSREKRLQRRRWRRTQAWAPDSALGPTNHHHTTEQPKQHYSV